MIYKDLQDAVIRGRFNEGDRTDVKLWLGWAYQRIWNAADWDFRDARSSFTVVTTGPTPVPSDFGREREMFDDQGDLLDYLPPTEFDVLSQGNGATVSRPEVYTRRNRSFEFLPSPDGAYTFEVSYRRRLCHLNDLDEVVAGLLSDDNDRPIWDEDEGYDGYLITQAKATGAALNGDPTSALVKDEAAALFGALMNERAAYGGPIQYGRDAL